MIQIESIVTVAMQADHQPSGARDMAATIVARTESGFAFQVKIPDKGSMPGAEVSIDDLLNRGYTKHSRRQPQTGGPPSRRSVGR
jgi:hypothetical protein